MQQIIFTPHFILFLILKTSILTFLNDFNPETTDSGIECYHFAMLCST